MITGLFQQVARRVLVGAGGILLLSLASGCGTGYPEDMTYGLRDDLLVIKTNDAKAPPGFDLPGQLSLLPGILAAQLKKGDVVNPNVLSANQRAQLSSLLDKNFGRPARPLMTVVDKETAESLQVDEKTLATGSVLYRRHCLHCHGLTGNGQGPTAPWVNPHPRDYRKGIFKFVSTKGGPNRKPSRQDLLRVLRQGVEGTSMPAFGAISGGVFGVLSDEELNQLASYVMHLSVRGQLEFEVINAVFYAQSNNEEIKIDDLFPAKAEEVVALWTEANAEDGQVIPISVQKLAEAELKKLADLGKTPPKDKEALLKELHAIFNAMPFSEEEVEELTKPLMADLSKGEGQQKLLSADVAEINRQSHLASVERGYNTFIGSACAQCHLDFGRKDNLLWDDWGTIVRPANLTLSTYRGGRRPVDLYWRIYSGIPGANMPANDALTKVDVKGADGKVTKVDQPWRLWDVVNFVQAAPYRKMLPEKIAETIHPQHLHSSE